ncbi:MAG TPA: tetratricopeptide repeat protein [Sphingomicrobium sp.]|nr:tetratricopeptide repeat protein [Sphingomicrobium sp.]
MRPASMILALPLGSALFAAVPASAQYSTPPAQQPQIQAPDQVPATAPRRVTVSKGARKAIGELQSAVNANDAANIPAKLAAAQAAARTVDDRLVVAQLQLKAALASKDDAATISALEALLAADGVDQADTALMYLNLGELEYKNKQYAKATAWLERAIAANPADTDALVLLAEARNRLGQTAEAVRLIERAVQVKRASGQKVDESWHRRAVALAYGAKLPSSVELSRQWVAAYPSPANWRDALKLFRQTGSPDSTETLDTLRLARATGALDEADVGKFAVLATDASSPGEAKSVIDEAVAAKQIDPGSARYKEIVAYINDNKTMSRASLPALANEARSAAAAQLAVRTANAYYGYGDYAEAAELYRAALTKTGADANLLNLRLGMALARAGDKASATAAFNAVTGPRSELAKFWLIYLGTRT